MLRDDQVAERHVTRSDKIAAAWEGAREGVGKLGDDEAVAGSEARHTKPTVARLANRLRRPFKNAPPA